MPAAVHSFGESSWGVRLRAVHSAGPPRQTIKSEQYSSPSSTVNIHDGQRAEQTRDAMSCLMENAGATDWMTGGRIAAGSDSVVEKTMSCASTAYKF